MLQVGQGGAKTLKRNQLVGTMEKKLSETRSELEITSDGILMKGYRLYWQEACRSSLSPLREANGLSIRSTEGLPNPLLLWTLCLFLYLVTFTPCIPALPFGSPCPGSLEPSWEGGCWGSFSVALGVRMVWRGFPWHIYQIETLCFFLWGQCYIVKFKNSGIVSIVSMGVMWYWPRWCCTHSVPLLQWRNAEVGNWLHLQQAVSKPPHCPEGDVISSLKVNPEKWPG